MRLWLLGSLLIFGVSGLIAKVEFLEITAPDGWRLRGSLMLPDTGNRYPVVLFIPGSGPVDRDGNLTNLPGKSDAYKLLATVLADSGVASLRYDKRGIGDSGSKAFREDSVRFEHFIGDAVAWVQKLRQDQRFTHIYLLGHSQGGLVALLTAQQIPVDGVILVAPQPLPVDQLILQQMKQRAPFLVPATQRILDSLRAGHLVDSIPPLLLSLFRPSVQPFIQSWMRYDPRTEIQKVGVPILVLCGTTDLQVRCEDVRAFATRNAGAEYEEIPAMNHLMKHIETTDLAIQQKSFVDPSIPLAPGLLKQIVNFIRAHSR